MINETRLGFGINAALERIGRTTSRGNEKCEGQGEDLWACPFGGIGATLGLRWLAEG